MPLNSGQILQARYRIEGLLGRGGMGAVYKATDTRFNTLVAIKENLQVTPESQKQFAREARLLHELQHPNLPRVTDYFVVAGQGQYLVMDYIEGEDLKELLSQQGRIPEAQALEWIGGVLDALEYLHSQIPRPIVHRDVKPANVKITPQGAVRLVDFGLAKVHDPLQKTTIGARGVTPGYAPPEQYGYGRTDVRTDIYSVGATLYALLTGKQPPDALDTMIGGVPLIPPRQLDPSISPATESAILRAMASRPARRFQRVADMRQALLATPTPPLAGREWSIEPPPGAVAGTAQDPSVRRPTTRPRRPKSPLPTWFWPMAGAAAALLVVLIIAIVRIVSAASSPVIADVTPTATATQAAEDPAGTPGNADLSTPGKTPSAHTPRPTLGPAPQTHTPAPTFSPTAPTPIQTPTLVPTAEPPASPSATPAPTISPSDTPTAVPAPTTAPPTPQPPPPSAGRIFFVSKREGDRAIFAMNPDGSGQRRLSPQYPAEDTFPEVSPDGKWLAFGSKRGDNEDIYVMRTDGTEERRLTDHPQLDRYPSWSPDASRIAFVSERDGNPEIYVMNADGSNKRRLTFNADKDRAPDWSPAGSRIAYQSGDEERFDIFIMNADGSGVQRLTNDGGDDLFPAWAPDGSRIAYISSRDGNREVYVMNADGSGKQRLTHNEGRDGIMSWSPNGQRIAFGARRGENKFEIYVMDADGSNVRQLTSDPEQDQWPTWSR